MRFPGLFRRLGPGILMAATAIGGSHLILSTKAGAVFGFSLLWLILAANLFKYHAFEFAPRYTITTGRSLLDAWLEGGVTGLYPWETQMGLDITRVRRDYPRLQMIGGIDKHSLAFGREAIDRELEKVPFMLELGRYLPCLDHGVPPGVSWGDFVYFCERLRDLVERHPPSSQA